MSKDFNSLLQRCKDEHGEIVIDLGCGPNKTKGTIGVDQFSLVGVDWVADIEKGLTFIPDNSIDRYVTIHFFEHLDNFELVLSEIYRTLKKSGKLTVKVPHFSNPYYYSDYTHKRFFGLYSFDYFSKHSTGYKRTTPIYNDNINFKIIKRRLVFSSPVFFVKNILKKHIITRLFNSSKFMQSLYEESFTNMIYCTELHFELQVQK